MPTDIPPSDTAEPTLSAVVIPLLKGVIYQENDPLLWSRLVALDAKVRDYVRVLDLELVLDEAEGYAFLRSRETDGSDPGKPTAATPRLFPRRQLSFPVSLLLALLRKKLAEFDASRWRNPPCPLPRRNHRADARFPARTATRRG